MGYLLKGSTQASLAVYTGSKSAEYYNGKVNIDISGNCLFSILNQRPNIVKVVRMTEVEGEKQILMANTVS